MPSDTHDASHAVPAPEKSDYAKLLEWELQQETSKVPIDTTVLSDHEGALPKAPFEKFLAGVNRSLGRDTVQADEDSPS